ncbi:protein of unknown function DUF434 [Pyrolobus fumarii 1A]|uniref:DUF434 domain-containing protein n=1 Tax=Pyrolobus fumarii (strain DSM 11204 / 1A) TaxID=694429 RepID=G0EFT2_PYRF1|nr:DUF434 domain-containing protein [Pyrolobus fumarii]AEM38253.1 protein of unknown function DUF434 [Pyrolobus fumarii 1A]
MEKPVLREDVLIEAMLDMYFLLSRGYPRRQSLEVVAARRGLNKWEKLAVYHCIHPYEVIQKVRRLTRCPPGGVYAVDGYNVIVSLVCVEDGIPVLICPDGFVRDVMGGWKPRPEEALHPLIEYLEALERHLGGRPIVYLDSRVSRSGWLASMIRREGFTAATSKTTDKSILVAAEQRGYTPITSDVVVLERVGGCNYLTHYVLLRGALTVDTASLLSRGFDSLARLWGVSPPWLSGY